MITDSNKIPNSLVVDVDTVTILGKPLKCFVLRGKTPHWTVEQLVQTPGGVKDSFCTISGLFSCNL